MINMDFTTTAVARPKILNQTLSSFSENLKGINLKDCRLIINIDPLPPNIKRKAVINISLKRPWGQCISTSPHGLFLLMLSMFSSISFVYIDC